MRRLDLSYYLKNLSKDVPAGFVVFLVALPLCLGIAVASGAPPFSGVLAGVIGGIIVSVISGSQLSVSGPAAGLTVIVAHGIENFGFNAFASIIALSGVLQIFMGFLGAGSIGAYFPVSVIKGMLTSIGIILIMKQIPHAIGYDADADADLSFLEGDSHTHLSSISAALGSITPGAAVISAVCLLILIAWEHPKIKKNKYLSMLPAALVAVLFGMIYNYFAKSIFPAFAVTSSEHLISLPILENSNQLLSIMQFPDLSILSNPQAYISAGTLALIGSLETLLSLEAVDKLDPMKRVAPPNQELKAQGIGNLMSGLIGGLPITAVIVRSSANIDAGAHTKISSIVHGLLLVVSILFLASMLNSIPLASLAAVLILTGYKLAKPKIVIEQYEKGYAQFVPYMATVVAILATDLLEGMAFGMAVGLFFVLRANYHAAFSLTKEGSNYLLRLQKDVSFINKAPLRAHLDQIESESHLIIDGTRSKFIDHDIKETLDDFMKAATEKNIVVEMKNMPGYQVANADFQ